MHRKWIGLMAKGAASHVLLLQDAKPLPPASLHRQAAPPKKRTAAPNTCERKQQKRARTSRSVVVKMFFLAAMVLRLVVAWCLILGWDGDDPCACALEGVGSKKEGLNECLRGYTYAKDKLRLVLLVPPGSVCVFVYHRHSTKRRKRCFLSLAAICGSQPSSVHTSTSEVQATGKAMWTSCPHLLHRAPLQCSPCLPCVAHAQFCLTTLPHTDI